jgi:acyl carrier protein
MMNDSKTQLRQLISEAGGLDPAFDGTANLYLDLGLPSMKAMQLLMDIEEKFGVAVPDDDFVGAGSLDELAALVDRLVAARDGGGN